MNEKELDKLIIVLAVTGSAFIYFAIKYLTL